MHIINLTPLEEGVYNDHNSDTITAPPEGWAMIPEGFPLPATFPRLGNVTAEEVVYPYEVTYEKPVTKTREVESADTEGNPVTITEEYEELVTVTEQREKAILTVTGMAEGTVPEPVPEEPTQEEDLMAMAIDHEYRLTMLELFSDTAI